VEEPKKTRAFFTRNTKYEKPEIEERVVELRSDGKTWGEITDIVSVELDEPNMSNSMARTIHSRAMSKTVTTEKRAGKKFKDYSEELDIMYGSSMSMLSRLVKAGNGMADILEQMIDDGEVDAIKAYGILVKMAPQLKAISSEVRDSVKFAIDQQDKIKIEEKGLIWDESQMLDYMEKSLKKLEKEGKIRWIKPKLN